MEMAMMGWMELRTVVNFAPQRDGDSGDNLLPLQVSLPLETRDTTILLICWDIEQGSMMILGFFGSCLAMKRSLSNLRRWICLIQLRECNEIS